MGYLSYKVKHYAFVFVNTRVSREPFWCYLHTLLNSNETYCEKVLTYLTAYDDGRECPLFSVVNYISDKKNDKTIEGTICFFDTKQRDKFQIFLSDNTTVETSERKIVEFQANKLLTSISMQTCVETNGFNYFKSGYDYWGKQANSLADNSAIYTPVYSFWKSTASPSRSVAYLDLHYFNTDSSSQWRVTLV